MTVVIVHHRGVELLERCLAALAASRGARLEVVVVANDCREEIPRRGDLALHVVESQRPLGFSAANNLGVAWARRHLARADHYLFLNDDTEVEPEAVALLAGDLEENPAWGVAGPLLFILGASDHLNSLGINVTAVAECWDEGIGRRLDEYRPLPGRREVLAVTGSALMMRAAAFDAVGGWTELFGYYLEDVDLCLKARSRGWSVVNDPRARVGHALSATAANDFKRLSMWRNQLLLVAMHWPWRLLVRVAPRLAARELVVFLRRLANGSRGDAALQARAWAGAARRLPR
ncbi:MAG TPA: glycosyltransferase family 2 protein, partial [Thermoanaerobaculia bacterium]|nr:glycosyltransferase family 2 protein [Thermoanaerobaculia bacterium]